MTQVPLEEDVVYTVSKMDDPLYELLRLAILYEMRMTYPHYPHCLRKLWSSMIDSAEPAGHFTALLPSYTRNMFKVLQEYKKGKRESLASDLEISQLYRQLMDEEMMNRVNTMEEVDYYLVKTGVDSYMHEEFPDYHFDFDKELDRAALYELLMPSWIFKSFLVAREWKKKQEASG